MKILLVSLLSFVMLTLSSCDGSSGDITEKDDSYAFVIKSYSRYMKDPTWREVFHNMGENQRKKELGFIMLPSNLFANIDNYFSEFGGYLSYAFYDIDGDGTKELLFGKKNYDGYLIFEIEACGIKGSELWFHTNENQTFKTGAIYGYNHSPHAIK